MSALVKLAGFAAVLVRRVRCRRRRRVSALGPDREGARGAREAPRRMAASMEAARGRPDPRPRGRRGGPDARARARRALARGTHDRAALRDRRRERAGHGLRGHAREADAPDRRAPRRHAASSTCTPSSSRRHVAHADHARRRRAPTACTRTSRRGGEAHTLAADLTVDGDADYAPVPARRRPRTRPTATGRAQARRPRADFTITKDGKPITTEPYLGAGGHLVALREGDLAFLHVHPEDGDGADASRPSSTRTAATTCTCSSSTAARVHTAEFTR